MKLKIIVEKRSDDYMAYIDGTDKKFWDCGATIPEAIKQLLISIAVSEYKDWQTLEIIREVN